METYDIRGNFFMKLSVARSQSNIEGVYRLQVAKLTVW